MKRFYYILIASIVLSITCAPVLTYAMPVPATQTDKKKAAEAKKKEAEKKKKEAEKAKAAKEKQKAAEAKKKEAEKKKAKAEKQRAQQAKANEQKREEAAKASEQKKAEAAKANAKAQAQREKEAAERAKVAAEREEAKARKEAEVKAQEEKALREYEAYQERMANPRQEVISYINVGLRGGYAAMMDKIAPMSDGSLWGAGTLNQGNTLQQLTGGGGAGIDLLYSMEYGKFRFETGVDFRFLNSTSNYGFQASRTELNSNAQYSYLFDDLKETRNIMQIGVPIMFGAQFSSFYFLAGAKIGYSLWSSYSQSGTYDILINDRALVDGLYGAGIHELNGETNIPIRFAQPEVSVAAEIGLDLDKWMQLPPKQLSAKEKKKAKKIEPGQRLPFGREHVHYRVALFAEYGVLNTNATPAAKPAVFNGDLYVQKTNTMLAMNGNTTLNNLFVGAKFTIQFEIPGKSARPVPAPPSYAFLTLWDAQTAQPLEAPATISTRDKETNKEIVRETKISKAGLKRRHPVGTYIADVKAEGYYPKTTEFRVNEIGMTDSIRIALQALPVPEPEPEPIIEMPVEKGEVFIMKNLHFATNRTRILPISEEALDLLYQHLEKNPDLRIRIIGHTDNIGRESANQKLSEGRAEAVRKELIERGITPERIEAEGRGESQPIDTNDTEEGRQNNRRVEIEIL